MNDAMRNCDGRAYLRKIHKWYRECVSKVVDGTLQIRITAVVLLVT
jgi:hypothetical protein